MPIGDQDHGRVALAMPIALSRLDQLLYFRGTQIFAVAEVSVSPTFRHDCSVFTTWRDQR